MHRFEIQTLQAIKSAKNETEFQLSLITVSFFVLEKKLAMQKKTV